MQMREINSEDEGNCKYEHIYIFGGEGVDVS